MMDTAIGAASKTAELGRNATKQMKDAVNGFSGR